MSHEVVECTQQPHPAWYRWVFRVVSTGRVEVHVVPDHAQEVDHQQQETRQREDIRRHPQGNQLNNIQYFHGFHG